MEKFIVQLVWSDLELTGFIVNGKHMSPEEFEKTHVMPIMENQWILEDLFVLTRILKAKIMSNHC